VNQRFSPSAIFLLLLMAVSTSLASETAHPHWSYAGATGPSHWSELEADYQSCALGKNQSPIDIRDEAAHRAHLPDVEFNYLPSALRIIDNGHTVQVNYAPGSFITVGGERYDLVQFHFHHPSEEKINGHASAMVAHLVHKNAAGKLAVVAVLLKSGDANAMLATLWSHLPEAKEKEVAPTGVNINVADMLPARHAYYAFTGSLTTPPCSEDVRWLVLREPTAVSASQIARFAKRYPMNARPTQPINGREIKTNG